MDIWIAIIVLGGYFGTQVAQALSSLLLLGNLEDIHCHDFIKIVDDQ